MNTSKLKIKFVIEHLEPLSPWVLIEYKHASKIVGRENLIITNVKDKKEKDLLRKIADEVYESSIADLVDKKDTIVLDPLAKRELRPEDAKFAKYFIFGGIMGDFTLHGRTYKFITSKMMCEARNLGNKQLSLDGAIFVAKEILVNRKYLRDIEFVDKPEIEVDDILTIELPYRYPLHKGKPVISKELVEFLRRDVVEYEESLLKRS